MVNVYEYHRGASIGSWPLVFIFIFSLFSFHYFLLLPSISPEQQGRINSSSLQFFFHSLDSHLSSLLPLQKKPCLHIICISSSSFFLAQDYAVKFWNSQFQPHFRLKDLRVDPWQVQLLELFILISLWLVQVFLFFLSLSLSSSKFCFLFPVSFSLPCCGLVEC